MLETFTAQDFTHNRATGRNANEQSNIDIRVDNVRGQALILGLKISVCKISGRSGVDFSQIYKLMDTKNGFCAFTMILIFSKLLRCYKSLANCPCP